MKYYTIGAFVIGILFLALSCNDQGKRIADSLEKGGQTDTAYRFYFAYCDSIDWHKRYDSIAYVKPVETDSAGWKSTRLDVYISKAGYKQFGKWHIKDAPALAEMYIDLYKRWDSLLNLKK